MCKSQPQCGAVQRDFVQGVALYTSNLRKLQSPPDLLRNVVSEKKKIPHFWDQLICRR